MSNKYIVKNCPCYNKDYSCQSKDNITGKYCQDCTDCITKQIIELCKHYRKHSDCGRDCSSFGLFLSKLLSKLDIQEVE